MAKDYQPSVLLSCIFLGLVDSIRFDESRDEVFKLNDPRSEELAQKIIVSPYSYQAYSQVLDTITDEEKELGNYEFVNTPDTNAVKNAVKEELTLNARKYIGHLDGALSLQRLVNRGLVLQDELLSGYYYTTMSIKSQSMALSVILPSLRDLDGSLNVLFGGCGIGDWAVETALEVDETSTVWCWNYDDFSMSLGEGIFQDRESHPLNDVFDMDMLTQKQLRAAIRVQEGTKLKYVCSNAEKPACAISELLTTEVDKFQRLISPDGFDAIIFGNSLCPEELQPVRDALRNESSFALIPVCLAMFPGEDEKAAAWYCEGVYWKISKSGSNDEPLMHFPSVMRPIKALSEKGFTQDSKKYSPKGWQAMSRPNDADISYFMSGS